MNEIGSLLQIGVSGVQSGLRNAQKASEDIVKSSVGVGEQGVADGTLNGGPVADIATAAVELSLSELQVKASAKVIQVADETIGTLIDTKA